MSSLLAANRPFFVPYAVFLLSGAVWQVFWSPTAIFLAINGANSPFADAFFTYFTHIGDGAFFAVTVIFLLFVRFRHTLVGAASFALSSGVAQGLKRLVFPDVLRPRAVFEGSSVVPHWVSDVELHSHHSFPSGHATTAFAVFCLLALVLEDKRWGVLYFVLALLAAYSRVYLGQHFFADIYFGSLIG